GFFSDVSGRASPPSIGTVQTLTSDWRSGVTTNATVVPSGETRGDVSRHPFRSASTRTPLPSEFATEPASWSPRTERTKTIRLAAGVNDAPAASFRTRPGVPPTE